MQGVSSGSSRSSWSRCLYSSTPSPVPSVSSGWQPQSGSGTCGAESSGSQWCACTGTPLTVAVVTQQPQSSSSAQPATSKSSSSTHVPPWKGGPGASQLAPHPVCPSSLPGQLAQPGDRLPVPRDLRVDVGFPLRLPRLQRGQRFDQSRKLGAGADLLGNRLGFGEVGEGAVLAGLVDQ